MASKSEKSVRKKLLGVGGIAIATSPFFGPGAPLIALAGAATIAGTGFRSALGRDVRLNGGDSNSADYPSAIPESAETAIARKSPEYASDLLEKVSKERLYQETLAKSYDSANRLIDLLPEGSLDNSRGIKLKVESKRAKWFSDEEEYHIRMRIKR